MKGPFALVFLFSICSASKPSPDPQLYQRGVWIAQMKEEVGCAPTEMKLGSDSTIMVDCESQPLEEDRIAWLFTFKTEKISWQQHVEPKHLSFAIEHLSKLQIPARDLTQLVPLLNQEHGQVVYKILARKTEGSRQIIRHYVYEQSFFEEIADGVEVTVTLRKAEVKNGVFWDVIGKNWEKADLAKAVDVCLHTVQVHMFKDFSEAQAKQLVAHLVSNHIARLQVENTCEKIERFASCWKVVEVGLSPIDPDFAEGLESRKIVKI